MSEQVYLKCVKYSDKNLEGTWSSFTEGKVYAVIDYDFEGDYKVKDDAGHVIVVSHETLDNAYYDTAHPKFEVVEEPTQEQPKLTPRSLGCFQEVADVIGEENAEIELQKVIDDLENDIDTGGGDDLMSNFTWCDTPQGPKFWVDISNSEVPEGYQTSCHQISTSGDNNQTKDSPAFGDLLHINGKPVVFIEVDEDGDHHAVGKSGDAVFVDLSQFDEYKPNETQELRNRILERWQRKSLDNSHDTEVCIAEMRVSDLIDFVVDNLNAEYSKE